MKRPLFLFIGALVVIFALILGFIGAQETREEGSGASVAIGDAVFSVDVADNDFSRMQGLSGRDALEENEGLFFIFPESGIYSFWMKDMLFPIDIIWIDESFHVVDITRNALPESYPMTFTPQTAVRYVLEVNAHVAERTGIQIGDTVQFVR